MAQLKLLRRYRPPNSRFPAVLLALLVIFCGSVKAEETESVPLQLEVELNGFPTHAIGAFALLPDGNIGSPRSELIELGIAVAAGSLDDIIPLNTVPGLSYVYDEEAQSIELMVGEASRIAKKLDAFGDTELIEAESSIGAMLNYTAYGAASYTVEEAVAGLNGGSVSLDARAFSPMGTLRQTGVVGTTTFADMTALRLDTTWSYSDQKRALTYHLGDIVSGGLNWTRPIRIGGGQVQRNFSLRPDLITMPLPLIEGSAKVPSMLDVYIDGNKAYSSKVQEGPFKLDNIPVYTTAGTVRVALTDTTGREIETETEFITSPKLLKHDLYDYSVEAGVVRRGFGSDSFGYADEPVALGSLRYGISDILTGEAHGEIGMDVVSVGAGLLFNGGKLGLFNGAVAASTYDDEQGVFAQLGWEASYGNLGISAAVSRTFGDFKDLAAIPEDRNAAGKNNAGVPKALERLTLTYSFPALKAGIGASFVHQESGDGKQSLLFNGSYSQSFENGWTVYGTAYADFGDDEDLGAFMGVSIPFGSLSSSANASISRENSAATAEISKPLSNDDMPVAWRVAHSESSSRITSADGIVKTNYASLQGSVSKTGQSLRANAIVEGAIAAAGGSIMYGRKIDDSFAIVDVGAANVPVQFENRPAGVTGSNGKILLPQLNAFQKNKISIDVEKLPLMADVGETEITVVPREMSGVVVAFGVKTDQLAALVILTDAAGNFLPESSEVFLDGGSESFLIGYDGQVYLTGIGAANDIKVKHRDGVCSASFAFKSGGDAQTVVGPIKCI